LPASPKLASYGSEDLNQTNRDLYVLQACEQLASKAQIAGPRRVASDASRDQSGRELFA
jgi:hypothetical protein